MTNTALEAITSLSGKKCQTEVRDPDLENEVKVLRSRNFDWPYLRQFLSQDQNVWCSENVLPNGFKVYEGQK